MTNFIVLSGFTLFPALREESLANTVYLYCALAVGALAAWSLWKSVPASGSGPVRPRAPE